MLYRTPLRCESLFGGGLKVFSLLPYASPLKSLVLSFKNGGRAHDCRALAQVLAKRAAVEGTGSPILDQAVVVPMPALHQTSKPPLIDHAHQVAIGVGEALGIEVRADLLRRAPESTAQKLLDREERKGLRVVATCQNHRLPEAVILTDDIITTGATLRQAWQALGGPRAVALTLAFTPKIVSEGLS